MARSCPSSRRPSAARWTAADTFVAKICFYETPFLNTISLKFSDGQVEFDSQSNVGFGPTKQPRLTGKSEK